MANKANDYDKGPCPICGRAIISLNTNAALADKTEICMDCAAKLRVMYPVKYGKRKGKKKIERLDPLSELTLDEVRDALKKAPAHLEQLRAEYGYNAVAKVEDIHMYSHGWFRPPYISVKGSVLFGFFDIGDEVTVIHRGRGMRAEILDIEREHLSEPDLEGWIRRGAGGYSLKRMVFSKKDLVISPGDIIVKGTISPLSL